MRILDEELRQLPTAYRLPLLLCYLEGQTQDQAVQQLGWSRTARSGGGWKGDVNDCGHGWHAAARR